MKKMTFKSLFSIVFFIFGTAFINLQAQPSQFSNQRFLVIFEDYVSDVEKQDFIDDYNSSVVWVSPGVIEAYLLEVISFPFSVTLPNGVLEHITDIHEGVTSATKRSTVKGAGLDYLTYIQVQPSVDPISNVQTPPLPPHYSCDGDYLQTDMQNMYEANVLIGFLDTGIGVDNSGISLKIINPSDDPYVFNNFINTSNLGYNYIPTGNYSEPYDDHGHGLHVASIAASVINDPSASIDFKFYKTHDHTGTGNLSDIIYAMDQGILDGVDVFNASIGYNAPHPDPQYPSPFEIALDHCKDHEIIFVAAAGNDDQNNDYATYPTYPASFEHSNVISVAAIDCFYELVEEVSNYGPASVDIAAPGKDIKGAGLECHTNCGSTTSTPSNLVGRTGTSMAVPYVSAIAAMGLSHVSQPSSDEVICAILNSATSYSTLASIKTQGYLNAGGVLSYLNNGLCNGQGNLSVPDIPVILEVENSTNWEVSPNPFNDHLNIQIDLEQQDNIILNLVDVNGKLIKQQRWSALEKGNHTINWNLSEINNVGIYFVQLKQNNQTRIKKVVRF